MDGGESHEGAEERGVGMRHWEEEGVELRLDVWVAGGYFRGGVCEVVQ